jgi:hypothetical protein
MDMVEFDRQNQTEFLIISTGIALVALGGDNYSKPWNSSGARTIWVQYVLHAVCQALNNAKQQQQIAQMYHFVCIFWGVPITENRMLELHDTFFTYFTDHFPDLSCICFVWSFPSFVRCETNWYCNRCVQLHLYCWGTRRRRLHILFLLTVFGMTIQIHSHIEWSMWWIPKFERCEASWSYNCCVQLHLYGLGAQSQLHISNFVDSSRNDDIDS